MPSIACWSYEYEYEYPCVFRKIFHSTDFIGTAEGELCGA